MRRLSMWMKAHPMVGDTLLALLLTVIDLLLLLARAMAPPGVEPPAPPWYIAVPVILGVVAPIVLRRKRPLWAAYLVVVIAIPHSALELGVAGFSASAIMLYTVVAYVSRRQALLYLVVNVVITGIQAPLTIERLSELVTSFIFAGLLLAFCWALGEFVGARRAYHNEVEQRLTLLETERDQQAQIAVAAERARIARELHDVVAHAVSVIVVQADGAAYAVHSNPELAERAVQTISATGREALAEMRRLLGVLRSENGGSERTPQPGTQSLAELAERVRAVGLPVQLDIVGNVDDLPAGVGLGIYRIVQEALTNAVKHAPGGRAEVTVGSRDGTLVVEVRNERTGLGPDRGTGLGLLNMRERAQAVGGVLVAGPHEREWRVRAELPAELTERPERGDR